jgi:hypothetical protein
MDIRHSRKITVMMIVLSLLALYASIMGVFNKTLYYDVYRAGSIPETLIWGSQAQDIVSIPIAVLLALVSCFFLKNNSMRAFICMLGMASYFFYAFGLYTIQGQYTSIYFVYMAIFGLSFYVIILGALSLKQDEVIRYQLPNKLRQAVTIFLFSIIGLLYPVWILRMMPDIANHVAAPIYGVYILDLCFVFPGIGMIAWMLLNKKPYGSILAGAALIKIFTLCFSWAFSELSNPFVGNHFMLEMALISSGLTIASGILFIPYILNLNKHNYDSEKINCLDIKM